MQRKRRPQVSAPLRLGEKAIFNYFFRKATENDIKTVTFPNIIIPQNQLTFTDIFQYFRNYLQFPIN